MDLTDIVVVKADRNISPHIVNKSIRIMKKVVDTRSFNASVSWKLVNALCCSTRSIKNARVTLPQ